MQMAMAVDTVCHEHGVPLQECPGAPEPLCALCEREKRRFMEVHFSVAYERLQKFSGEFDSLAYLPSPEEIRAECLSIQEGWSAKDFRRRTGLIGDEFKTVRVKNVHLPDSFFDGEEE